MMSSSPSVAAPPASFPSSALPPGSAPLPPSSGGGGIIIAPQLVRDPTHVPVTVSAVQFGIVSEVDTHRLSVLPCRRVAGGSVAYGVNDPVLGTCDRSVACRTCGKSGEECVGHTGHIDLELPVFHAGFFTTILRVCRTICKTCSRVLLEKEEVAYFTYQLATKMEAQHRLALVKRIQEDAYKTHICPQCGAMNGEVKRGIAMRIIHDKYGVQLRKSEKMGDGGESSAIAQLHEELRSAARENKVLEDRLGKVTEVLDPVRVRDLFSRIVPSEMPLLGFQPGCSSPLDMLVSSIVVPPVCVRPSGGGGATVPREDDITAQLNEILICSNALKDGANDVAKYAEMWDQLQIRVARLLDAQMPGFPAALRSTDTKSYAQRIKGKHGRFRGNLSGKRVDFSGRSVISPDPNLDVDELAVPLSVARVLTYPQRVFSHNLEFMRRLVRNGPSVHPGAISVYLAAEKSKRWLRNPRDRQALAARLAVGDVVERHVINGDMIIFNRQPSLHRISMMAHRARVLPYRTFRFNECCCSPYNADFDGDEMNVHLVQTEEARAEALELMLTAKNIVTAKNGEPIIACTQDFLTAAYLVTSRQCFFDRSQFTQMVSHWLGPKTMYDLPIPALLRPTELWTGKQLFELILRPAYTDKVFLNLHAKARSYSGKDRHWDPNEGFVSFLDSTFISGRLDKKLLGGGAKDSLFARLFALTSGEYTARCMSRIAHFTSRYLQNYGFSLGLADVSPTVSLEEEKRKALEASFAECDRLIQEAASGRMTPIPGMTLKQSLEAKLNGELSQVRNTCGSAAVRTLDPRSNAPLIMVNSGSKGSELNTAQMMACVGQQTVSGKRIVNAFDDRSLPHFHRYAEYPAARGFVANSFFSGLSPTEFFFHTMAGREGLVDTAVKTAETGYLYRRLSKALENVSVRYDYTVRNARNEIVQFRHGEDGMDPWLMEGNQGSPLNLELEWLECRSAYARHEQRRVSAHTTLEQFLRREDLLQTGASLTPSSSSTSTVALVNTVKALLMTPREINEWYHFSILPEQVIPFVQQTMIGDEGCLRQAEVRAEKEHAEYLKAVELKAHSLDEGAIHGGRQALGFQSGNDSDKNHREKGPEAAKWLRRMRDRKFCMRFQEEVQKFFEAKVAEQKRLRELLDLPVTQYAQQSSRCVKTEPNEEGDTSEGADGVDRDVFVESLQTELLPMTPTMLFLFLEHCAAKYIRKICEPGTPCGSIAAQSVGEPSTQMTLRTFHFAGVASMSITQGVPRLKEIINANVNISTPVITAPIRISLDQNDETYLQRMSKAEQIALLQESGLAAKGLVERVCLKDVTEEIVEVMTASSYQILIRLNMPLIKRLFLPIDAFTVRQRILKYASRPMSPLRMLKESGVTVISRDALYVYPFKTGKSELLFNVKQLLTILPDIMVGGMEGMNRVMISDNSAQLLAEGTELRSVMTLPYVDGKRCKCNHVAVVQRTLGIEAARQTIVDEISSIMKAYSLNIDIRHVYLLADLMTHHGTVLGITRYGLQKMNNSVLTMASFERTTEHLYNAAIIQRKDTDLDVSDSIMLGKPVPLGTNSFSVLMDQGGREMEEATQEANGTSPSSPNITKAAAAAPVVPNRFSTNHSVRPQASVSGKLMSKTGNPFERWSGYARFATSTASYYKPLAAENTFRVDILI